PRTSGFLLGVHVGNRVPQQRSHFFLYVDDDLRFTELFRQLANLSAQLLVFFRQGVALRSGTALARLQGLLDAGLAFPPPARQMRGIQPFPAKQCSNSARSGGGSIRLFENTDLVLHGKRTTLCLGHDFGIRSRRGARQGARFGCRCTPLRLARRRAFAPFRGSQTPRGKNNTKFRVPMGLPDTRLSFAVRAQKTSPTASARMQRRSLGYQKPAHPEKCPGPGISRNSLPTVPHGESEDPRNPKDES